ncbi:M15 family metallopeptidase [Myroides sp. WP-1]|uniref:M15 family metallopeptidase n=1 Tax=Myroides sp. WP-1 TaxID=2759944 RepID=UPI0015F894FD|nr:M15 family metallopeptidase [Myroides sp. WP-1]MBB1138094.1 M15 family metallopeptidase [Myroides sp. WP-1]
MNVLKPNMQEADIAQWKQFLQQIGQYSFPIDDHYDSFFEEAIKNYQKQKKLVPDGFIGNQTWLSAYLDGMKFSPNQQEEFPFKPNFMPITKQETKFELFGLLTFQSDPNANNPENIVVLNDFEQKNIVTVEIPQFKKLFGNQYHTVRFHRKGVKQLLAFFAAIEEKKLLPLLLTYGGSYTPRLVRGSKTTLSNHAFGIAFDLNMQWNALNQNPALLGNRGSLREIVPLAHQFGFYWGGHFSRQDGMHFELAQLL